MARYQRELGYLSETSSSAVDLNNNNIRGSRLAAVDFNNNNRGSRFTARPTMRTTGPNYLSHIPFQPAGLMCSGFLGRIPTQGQIVDGHSVFIQSIPGQAGAGPSVFLRPAPGSAQATSGQAPTAAPIRLRPMVSGQRMTPIGPRGGCVGAGPTNRTGYLSNRYWRFRDGYRVAGSLNSDMEIPMSLNEEPPAFPRDFEFVETHFDALTIRQDPPGRPARNLGINTEEKGPAEINGEKKEEKKKELTNFRWVEIEIS